VTNRLADVGTAVTFNGVGPTTPLRWSTCTGPEASYLVRPRLCRAQPCLDLSAVLDEAAYRVVRPQRPPVLVTIPARLRTKRRFGPPVSGGGRGRRHAMRRPWTGHVRSMLFAWEHPVLAVNSAGADVTSCGLSWLNEPGQPAPGSHQHASMRRSPFALTSDPFGRLAHSPRQPCSPRRGLLEAHLLPKCELQLPSTAGPGLSTEARSHAIAEVSPAAIVVAMAGDVEEARHARMRWPSRERRSWLSCLTMYGGGDEHIHEPRWSSPSPRPTRSSRPCPPRPPDRTRYARLATTRESVRTTRSAGTNRCRTSPSDLASHPIRSASSSVVTAAGLVLADGLDQQHRHLRQFTGQRLGVPAATSFAAPVAAIR
jgi:hypothetical protein